MRLSSLIYQYGDKFLKSETFMNELYKLEREHDKYKSAYEYLAKYSVTKVLDSWTDTISDKAE